MMICASHFTEKETESSALCYVNMKRATYRWPIIGMNGIQGSISGNLGISNVFLTQSITETESERASNIVFSRILIQDSFKNKPL